MRRRRPTHRQVRLHPATKRRRAEPAPEMVNVLTDYKVSQATVRDVHLIRRLEQLVFGEDAYTYLSLANLLMWPGGANFKVTDEGGSVVGFVAGSPNYSTHTDWIVTLGVHPDHQRRGLGRWLLVTCEDAMS